MSIRARRCSACGGPLPEGGGHDTTITCSFCGMVNEVSADTPRIIVNLNAGDTVRYVGSYVKLAIGLSIGLTIIGVIVAIVVAMRSFTTAIDVVRHDSSPVRMVTRGITMSDLPKLAERGYRTLDAPPPPGGWTSFDPVVGVGWVSQIARAWTADARLERIDLTLIAADGTADLTTDRDETVGYRFVSPSRIAQWRAIADSVVDAQIAYELFIRVGRQQVSVYAHSGNPGKDDAPPGLDGLPLRDLLTRARRTDRFPELPFYTGFLLYLDRMGWVWNFQSLSRRESIPSVRARDGAVYPWQ
jgi:hypothetical protein